MTSWADTGLQVYGQQWGWGWVIYRTVYTEESDQLWDETLEKIKQATFADYDVEAAEESETDRNRAKALYSNVIIADREVFENATVDAIRQHFLTWLDENDDRDSLEGENVKLKHPLIIDEVSLNGIKSWPLPSPAETFDLPEEQLEGSFVRIVDIENSQEPPKRAGWMNAGICSLYSLWFRLVEEDLKSHAVYIENSRHKAWTVINELVEDD